jgi:hypothetical protein
MAGPNVVAVFSTVALMWPNPAKRAIRL